MRSDFGDMRPTRYRHRVSGETDSSAEIDASSKGVEKEPGPEVPVHFTAFHPDWKMTDRPRTPAQTPTRARAIAMNKGLRCVWTGNVHDTRGGGTLCHACGTARAVRDWYEIGDWRLRADGQGRECGTACTGRFDGPAGTWGAKRLPVRMGRMEAPAPH